MVVAYLIEKKLEDSIIKCLKNQQKLKLGIEYKSFIKLLSFFSIINLNLHTFSPFSKVFQEERCKLLLNIFLISTGCCLFDSKEIVKLQNKVS